MNMLLSRIDQSDKGTFGVLANEHGQVIAVTCERPDNGNHRLGCIPLGSYQTEQYDSPTKGRVFLVKNVPGRTMIEIHRGNTINDTMGCILVGKGFGYIGGVKAVIQSSVTMQNLLALYTNGFTLEIEDQT